jgi:hypothetical protein
MTQPRTNQGSLNAAAGAERRCGQDRRHEQRRGTYGSVTIERRSGEERRYWEERRAGVRRRAIEQQAARVAGSGAPPRSNDRERARAKRLLEEFVAMTGPADQRLPRLVRRHWPSYPLGARALLVASLSPILEPAAQGRALTDELRQAVENAVIDWAARL